MSYKYYWSANEVNGTLDSSDIICQRMERKLYSDNSVPAFSRIVITLLHEEPSAQNPWTRTIFVAFVAMLFTPVGWINVLFWALARPECVVNERVTISDKVRKSNPKIFPF
jgi:hypothetical protein